MFSRDKGMFISIMCRVILKALTVESGFQKTPSNTVAVVGQMMKMSCWTNPEDTTQWFFNQNGEKTPLLVYNGEFVSANFTSRFNVNNSTGIGHHDLISNDVKLADAGIYACEVLSRESQDRSIPVSATAELIVLESEPQCSTNVSAKDGNITEFDYVSFRCAVNFSGRWAPSVQWSKGKIALSETPVVINRNISNTVQHLSSVIILQVSAEYNGIMISCKTEFIETSVKVHNTNATNIPNYSFHWNTTLNVHFGARNVTITPRKKRYRLEDVLDCIAGGKPSPSYTWKYSRTNETIAAGPQLALSKTRIDADQRYTIECIAQNHVAGELKMSSITVDVQVDHNVAGTDLLQITFVMGIVCAILLLIAIVIGKEHIKGLIAKLTAMCRREPTTEPDVLPNADGHQNGSVANYELERPGHDVIPGEIVAYGNVPRQRDENEIGSHAVEEGAVSINWDQRLGQEIPVYAEINKAKKYNKPESTTVHPSQTLSGDSKLKNNEYVVGLPECKADNSDDTAKNPSTTKMSIGLDGTVYAELKADGDLYQPQSSVAHFQDPMFNKSEYASIDHTKEPPSPS